MKKRAQKKSNYRTQERRPLAVALGVAFVKRFGGLLSFFVLIACFSLWVFLSDAHTRSIAWTKSETLNLSNDMGFTVKAILLEGRVNSDGDVIKGLINIEKGDPIFSFGPKQAKELIERIAWVKSAHIERRLPSTIYIAIDERKPTALWKYNGKTKLLDEEGEAITDYNIERFSELLIVKGKDAYKYTPSLVALLKAEPKLEKRVVFAEWIGKRRWDLTTDKGVVIKLPEEKPSRALKELSKAHDKDKILDLELKVVDMRQDSRIIIRAKSGQDKEYQEYKEYKAGFRL